VQSSQLRYPLLQLVFFSGRSSACKNVPFQTSDSTSYHLNLPLLLSLHYTFKILVPGKTGNFQKMVVDWTQLLRELLQSISKEFTLYSDYVRLRAVCPHGTFQSHGSHDTSLLNSHGSCFASKKPKYNITVLSPTSLPTRPIISSSKMLFAPSFEWTPPTVGSLLLTTPQQFYSSTFSPWPSSISLLSSLLSILFEMYLARFTIVICANA